MKVTISIVVPSLHRETSLLRLLMSLIREIHENPAEVIVVEQGENNSREFKEFARKRGIPLVYIHLDKPSTPRAMNVGARRAKGKYILFLDDDVTVRKGLIESTIKNFQDPKIAAVCGRVITHGQKIEAKKRKVGRVEFLGVVSGGFSSTVKQEVDTVIGCNTCWRRDVFLALGGMDEQFTGNALRLETDLSLRAKKRGYKIVFEPQAVVDHHREPTGGARKSEGRMKWYFDFFSNETYFFLKHRPKVLLPIFLLTKSQWALRCMFGFGREVSGRSIITPISGIMNGLRKYYGYRC